MEKMGKKTLEEIVDIIYNDDSNLDFAFRGDNYIPESGIYNNSWYHGDDADEFELDGVSAIALPSYNRDAIRNAISMARRYGSNVVLLAGNQTNAHEWAHDTQECLMRNSKIIAIVDAKFTRKNPLADWVVE